MKIISFGLKTIFGPLGFQVYFELTDQEYDRLNNMEFDDVYDFFHHCAVVCVSAKNQQFFYEDDSIELSGDVFEKTGGTITYFYYETKFV